MKTALLSVCIAFGIVVLLILISFIPPIRRTINWADRKIASSKKLSITIGFLVLALPALYKASKDDGIFKKLFEAIPSLGLICTFSVPILYCVSSFVAWRKEENRPLALEDASFLIQCIDEVVEDKLDRFGNFLADFKNMLPAQRKACNVFETITQPKEQMKSICQRVWTIFFGLAKETGNGATLKVALASMGKKHIQEFAAMHPRSAGAQKNIKKMQDNRCSFSVAKKNKRTLVLPSTKVEAKKGDRARFLYLDDESDLVDCSIICYPICDPKTGDYPYVLSIWIDRPKVFKTKQTGRYNSVLDRFAQRIMLEHYLLEVKKNLPES